MLDRKGMRKRIKELRGEESQKSFGERFGYSHGRIGHIERGRGDPSLDLLLGISLRFGVSTDFILKGTPKKVPKLGAPDIREVKEVLTIIVNLKKALEDFKPASPEIKKLLNS